MSCAPFVRRRGGGDGRRGHPGTVGGLRRSLRHAGCNTVRQFVAIRCGLCGERIGYAAESGRRAGWRVLGHRACVLADLDSWERIGQEEVAP
ncbi:MAG: hypothetical protein ACRDZ4_04280 [Egibacteraceae bacterium]